MGIHSPRRQRIRVLLLLSVRWSSQIVRQQLKQAIHQDADTLYTAYTLACNTLTITLNQNEISMHTICILSCLPSSYYLLCTVYRQKYNVNVAGDGVMVHHFDRCMHVYVYTCAKHSRNIPYTDTVIRPTHIIYRRAIKVINATIN